LVSVWRDGSIHEVDLPLSTPTLLVPIHASGTLPSYLIYAGFVFVPLSRPYLRSEYGKSWLRHARRFIQLALRGYKEYVDHQVVILSQVLASSINIGYHELSNLKIDKFNGVEIRNLLHLKHLIDESKQEFNRFDLALDKVVVVNRIDAIRSNDQIIKEHNLPSLMSRDLQQQNLKVSTNDDIEKNAITDNIEKNAINS